MRAGLERARASAPASHVAGRARPRLRRSFRDWARVAPPGSRPRPASVARAARWDRPDSRAELAEPRARVHRLRSEIARIRRVARDRVAVRAPGVPRAQGRARAHLGPRGSARVRASTRARVRARTFPA